MVASYDSFRPMSRITSNKDGTTAERSIQIYAATEIAAKAHSDAPKLGESITDGTTKLYCNSVTADEVPEGVNSAGLLLFEVKATYQTLDKSPVEGKARWSVAGQNEQVKRFAVDGAGDKQDYPEESGSAPGSGNTYTGLGINITEDGAEGVDVDDPYEVLKIDLWMAPSATGAYLNTLRALRNKVNAADFAGPWGTYAAGSARITTFNVQHISGELDQVSIEFLQRENTSFDVDFAGGATSTVSKLGQQYYWQRNVKTKAGESDEKAQADIVDAHVDTVYKEGDFGALGITWAMFDMTEPGS